MFPTIHVSIDFDDTHRVSVPIKLFAYMKLLPARLEGNQETPTISFHSRKLSR